MYNPGYVVLWKKNISGGVVGWSGSGGIRGGLILRAVAVLQQLLLGI